MALPNRFDRFFSPSLLVIGITLVGVALFLLSRPVVDRRLTTGRAAEFRARDIVRRHGRSTLDYFALRSDKQWFFFRDSLVAYAIYGGICLIAPDPIGPRNEREQVWGAFRRFADDHGWVPAIMGAGEDWLPIYRESGMHNVYIGDEAVVDVQNFSLAGGGKKGLRQAHNRIKKYGYTATFHDPSRLDHEDGRRAHLADGAQSSGRPRARVLHDVGPHLRSPRPGSAPGGGPRPRRKSGGHVPVRPGHGHQRLLPRSHAPRSRRTPQRAAGLRPVLHHRAPQVRWLRRPQPQLRRPPVDPGRREGRRHRATGGAVVPQAGVELRPDRDAVAVQRKVRPRLAPALRGLRYGRASGARHHGHPPGRVPVGDPGPRSPPGRRGREADAGGPAGDGPGHRRATGRGQHRARPDLQRSVRPGIQRSVRPGVCGSNRPPQLRYEPRR